MNKFKNLRQIGYGAAGLTIGVIVYLMLSANAPMTPDVRSTLPEFTSMNDDFEQEYVTDEDYTGDIVPLFPHGSYRVSQADFDEYERLGVVTYGKVNPTFYFDMPAANPENEEGQEETTGIRSETNITNVEVEDVEDSDIEVNVENESADLADTQPSITIPDSSENSSDIDDAVFNTGGRRAKIIDGFNIHTTKTEKFNVEDIRDEFAENAVFPIDIEYFNISSDFGVRQDPFTKSRAFHAGVDFAQRGIEGANIYSVLDGEVVESVTNFGNDGLGNYVVIDHGEFQTLYAHMLEAPELEEGDVVQAGDVVGTVGSTGRSTGPHLHFEVGVGGIKFDGLEFLIDIVDKNNDGRVTVEEAEQAGFTGTISRDHWLHPYMTNGN